MLAAETACVAEFQAYLLAYHADFTDIPFEELANHNIDRRVLFSLGNFVRNHGNPSSWMRTISDMVDVEIADLIGREVAADTTNVLR